MSTSKGKKGSPGDCDFPDVANMAPYEELNHPVIKVSQSHVNDVLFGRGGGMSHHEGNKVYRKMVEDRKPKYVNATRKGRPKLSFEIINWVRYQQNPPGRFLKYDLNDGGWRDVGDKKAREKTSQALRGEMSNFSSGIVEEGDDAENTEDSTSTIETSKA
jgi:hypothetical protein